MQTMRVLELSGVHIGRKVRVKWKLPRKNAKLHEFVGYFNEIRHNYMDTDAILYSRADTLSWESVIQYNVPFYAEVEFLDD